ncbi:MAG: hypothetical protein DHS20C08_02210 [Rhodomicrobium sp.]|nr:MAG: hypothetical protein DHS20C08_02210 [Rhodomicrobium sp.]
MRHVLGLFGVIAASALVIVSAAMNWRFGFGLGKTEFDGQVYGLASVAADCLKAIVPFLIIYAWKTRKWAQALAGVALGVICTGYSVTSSIGFAATNRADNNGERMIRVANYKDQRAELKRLEEKLSWMPKHRPAEAVAASLEQANAQPVKLRGKPSSTVEALTDGCTKTNWTSRKYCANIFDLRKELAISEEAAKIDARIREIRKEFAKATSVAAAGKADPQADLISTIFGLKLEDTQTVLILLVSLLVEAGSALGYFVVFSMWKLDPRAAIVKEAETARGSRDRKSSRTLESTYAREDDSFLSDNDNLNELMATAANDEERDPILLPKNEMDRFYDERIERVEGESTTATQLYDDYCEWCKNQGSNPMSQIPFGKQLSQMDINKAKIAGRIRYKGIRLRPRNSDYAKRSDIRVA